MAAKPPKPPGNFLNKNNNNRTTANAFSVASNKGQINNINNNNTAEENNVLDENASSRPHCNCTNISIMHLFHEMKQEFPTIPDTIVTQCVNENCHQREICMQMLRNELDQHPIPAPTYPSKVLQQQRQHNHQQQQQQSSKKPTTTPLRPIRVAPLQPPTNAKSVNPKLSPFRKLKNCDSTVLANERLINDVKKFTKSVIDSNCVVEGAAKATRTPTTTNSSDMPTTTTPSPIRVLPSVNAVNSVSETAANANCQNETSPTNVIGSNQPTSPLQHVPPPRARPTTLNLQTQLQQQQLQQRQQLHVQLQQHIQQRQQLQQQQQQQSTPHKPCRKAPLPPIPPKPAQFTASAANSPQFYHHSQNAISPHSQPSNSISNESSNLTSPMSSGDSEISVNVSLSSPTAAMAPHQHNNIHNQPHQSPSHPQLKSPVRHRSVLNVQPEPPYTRDFLVSPTSSNGSQKSFTSVNLTLRQPNNSSIPPSTIDISAGPGLSGNGSGLTYSSTSYDARRGYQKNFHITVTDEGGVFSASRIRPRSCVYPEENEQDGSHATDNGGVNPLRAVVSEQSVLQYQQQQQEKHRQQQYPRQQPPMTVAASNSTSFGNICLPREFDVSNQILERQKTRRDKLATALRDNKKRLSQVEEVINVLVEPVPPGESERLDSDIQKLRFDCQSMLNEIENVRRSGDPSTAADNNSVNSRQQVIPTSPQHQQQQQQQQQQFQQPFLRQRPPRPPTGVVRQQQTPHLDFIQHHSNTASPTLNSPTTAIATTPTSHSSLTTYQPYQASTDEEDYSDSNTDGVIDDEEPLEMWACNLCTFRNHPQLNVCECCENVRILPGTIRIVSTTGVGGGAAAIVAAATAATNTSAGNASLESNNDANLTPQQPQQFALHT